MKKILLSLLIALSSCVRVDPSLPQQSAQPLGFLWGHADGALYVAGDKGSISSYQLGAAWTQRVTPTKAALFGLWSDETSLYAVGAAGTLLRSTDGERWELLHTNTTRDLYGVWGDEQRLLVIGQDGLVLRSSDHGETWSQQWLVKESLRAVWGGLGHLFIVGDGGVILHSTDGGLSWSQEHKPRRELSGILPQDFKGVSGDGTGVYVVGAGGALLSRSWSEGRWQQWESDTTEELSSIWSDDRGGLLALGKSGVLVRGSLDTLISEQRGALYDLRGAWMSRSGSLLLLSSEWRLFSLGGAGLEGLAQRDNASKKF